MSVLVFAILAKEIKQALKKRTSDPDVIMLLYDSVAEPAGLKNRNSDMISVSKGTASRIMNRQSGGEIRDDIREHCQDQIVIDNIEKYVRNCIIKRFLKGKDEQILHNLTELVTNDDLMSDETRARLLSFANKEQLALFIGHTLLYTLSIANLNTDDQHNTSNSVDSEERKKHPLPPPAIPSSIAVDERRYITALLEVYAEQTGDTDFAVETLDKYPKLKKHFQRQRADYFAAETVRRGTRDIYDDKKEEYFSIFLKEIHDGIIEVYEDEYETGYKRLVAVLTAASDAGVAQCWISRDTVWIGNSQKKGACHILVNRQELDGWVD